MGIREKLNENPAITTAVAAGVLLILLIVIAYQLMGGRQSGTSAVDTQMYYTTDDGKTYEPDAYDAIYSLDANGQPRVRAYVYQWEEGGEPFVAYLERMTPQAIQQYQQAAQSGDPGSMLMIEGLDMEGRQVKKPGEGRWVPAMSPPGQQISEVPMQGDKIARPVFPND